MDIHVDSFAFATSVTLPAETSPRQMNISLILNEFQDKLTEMQNMLNVFSALTGDEDRTIDILLTRKEAASFIGRSVRQLDRLCQEGKIDRDYSQGSVRFRRSELLRFKGILTVQNARGTSEMEEILRRYKGEGRR